VSWICFGSRRHAIITNLPSYPNFNEMEISVFLLFGSPTRGAAADTAVSKTPYFSLGYESYPVPELCSLVWVYMNGFVSSR
jgi:hypothetical protein